MAYTLPDLPYPKDALEPHIDAMTMEIHHGKHHNAYVTNLNKALEDHADLGNKSIEDLMRELSKVPEAIRTAVRNNGGGHANHSMFWLSMKKGGGGAPKGELAKAVDSKFGSFDKFKEQFSSAAMTRFGSGWAWLGLDESGELHVGSTANQDSPYSQGHLPILGLDVWEHAYYLKYQNRRPDYVGAWWDVVDWDIVSQRYADAKK